MLLTSRCPEADPGGPGPLSEPQLLKMLSRWVVGARAPESFVTSQKAVDTPLATEPGSTSQAKLGQGQTLEQRVANRSHSWGQPPWVGQLVGVQSKPGGAEVLGKLGGVKGWDRGST